MSPKTPKAIQNKYIAFLLAMKVHKQRLEDRIDSAIKEKDITELLSIQSNLLTLCKLCISNIRAVTEEIAEGEKVKPRRKLLEFLNAFQDLNTRVSAEYNTLLEKELQTKAFSQGRKRTPAWYEKEVKRLFKHMKDMAGHLAHAIKSDNFSEISFTGSEIFQDVTKAQELLAALSTKSFEKKEELVNNLETILENHKKMMKTIEDHITKTTPFT